MLVLNVWLSGEKDVPDYLPQMLNTLQKNPSLSVLLVATFESPRLCPKDGSLSTLIGTAHRNIQIHCMHKADLNKRFTSAMCDLWACSPEEEQLTHKSINTLLENTYKMNDMKPLYHAALQDVWEATFPKKNFSHWLRMDLDVYVGNFDAQFPWDRIEYDVIAFIPGLFTDSHQSMVRGFMGAFKLSAKMRDHWVRMPKFSTPTIFSQEFKNLRSTDEGLVSKTLLKDPDVSFVLLPGLVYEDTIIRTHQRKLILSGDSNELLLVKNPLDKAIEQKGVQFAYKEKQQRPPAGPRNATFIRYLEMSDSCKFFYWVPGEDQHCVHPDEDLSVPPGHYPSLARAPGGIRLGLYAIPDPGQFGLGEDVRSILAIHLLDTKKPYMVKYHIVTTEFYRYGAVVQPSETMEYVHVPETREFLSHYYRKDPSGTLREFVPVKPANWTG